MTYPLHGESKSGGCDWFETIPLHWRTLPLKRAITFQRGHDLPAEQREDGDVPVVSSGGISARHSEPSASAPGIVTGRYGSIGEFYLLERDYWPLNTTLFSVDLHGNYARYLRYMLQHLSPLFVMNAVKSAVPGVDRNDIHPIPVALPPLDEQLAIATFLDGETTKLDSLIGRKEQLMELLVEKRETCISDAVTKGLNREAPMHDSGVEWLGRIPRHWKVVQSRRYFRERREKARSTDEQLTASQKYGVVLQSEFMRAEGQKVMQVIKGADILKHIEPNDFVISMRSFQGGIEWCRLQGCISSAYVPLIPSNRVEPRFFSYLFKSGRYIQALQATSNLVRDGQALRFENFAQVPLPLLDAHEQIAIADFLDNETSKIDALLARVQIALGKLRELRSALISAAVTGQIDVRNYRSQEAAALCQ